MVGEDVAVDRFEETGREFKSGITVCGDNSDAEVQGEGRSSGTSVLRVEG